MPVTGFSCSMRGIYKPLTHVKTDCGLGFLGRMPASGMRRTSGTCRSILSTATMTAKRITTGLTAFSPPVSVLVSNYSLQFHSWKVPSDPSCYPCTVSPLFPLLSNRNEAVADSFVEQSACLTMFLVIPTLCFSFAASEWVLDQVLKSALHFSPHALQCPPAQVL